MAKKKGGKAEVTVDEVIATLKRTSLPTIIVEGSDDIIVYRRLEDRFSDLGISVLPVGGREKVLNIFDRRSEIGDGKFIFIADRDAWIYTDVPKNYIDDSLIFTTGYSIENDIFVDGNLDCLLVGNELRGFLSELEIFTRWYAIALSRHMLDATKPYKDHPSHILDSGHYAKLTELNEGEGFPEDLYRSVFENYKFRLRGKSLMNLLIRNTNGRKGLPRHTIAGLIECVANAPGDNLNRVARRIGELIG